MSSIEHQVNEIHCFTHDYFKAHPISVAWRHSPISHPAFTDSEVLTIALLHGSLGCLRSTDRRGLGGSTGSGRSS